MKTMFQNFPLLFASASLATFCVSAHQDVTDNDLSEHFRVDDTLLDTKLPSGTSDHTATLVGTKVYIAGGCDDPNGNTYDAASGNFYCGSVTDAFYSFDIETEEIEGLASLPMPRYRHAAAHAGGKIWIHGGRSLFDDIRNHTLAFDIESGAWTSFTNIPEKYQLSDNTGFSDGTYAYFAGGYTAGYTAVKTTFRINPMDTDFSSDTPAIEDRADMNLERGDVASASADTYAVIAGGFTHANDYCQSHAEAESYSFADDTWSNIDDMDFGRSDKVVVALGNEIYVLGGERQVEGKCEGADPPEPGERTIVVDKVERYDVDVDEWYTLADLPDGHRFRFAGVGYTDKIYTFGGQQRYDLGCDCFKTVDEITIYQEVQISDPGHSGAGLRETHAVNLVLTAFFMGYVLML